MVFLSSKIRLCQNLIIVGSDNLYLARLRRLQCILFPVTETSDSISTDHHLLKYQLLHNVLCKLKIEFVSVSSSEMFFIALITRAP